MREVPGAACDQRRDTLPVVEVGKDEMAKIRIGFAGVGFMGQVAHLRNYLKNPDCEVVAIAEPRKELARKVAETYHIPKVYASHLDLVDDPDVEAVVASQPHLMNGHISIPLLRAGKSVFVEKPMAGSFAEAADMVEAAQTGGARLMVGFMKRYDSGVQVAKKAIEEMRVSRLMGDVAFLNAYCFGGDWVRGVDGPIATNEPVPTDPSFAPRSPAWLSPALHDTFHLYMNIFSHNLNLMRYLVPGAVQVRGALLKSQTWQQTSMFECDGVPFNLYGAPVSCGWWEEMSEAYFDEGWIRVRTPSPLSQQCAATVEVYQGGKVNETRMLKGSPYWAFRAQADHFVECLRHGVEPRTSGEDSLEDMRLMEEVFRKAHWL